MLKAIVAIVVSIIVALTILIPVSMDYSDDDGNEIYVFVIMGQSNAAYNSNVDVPTVNSDPDLIVQPTDSSYFFGYNQTSPITYNSNHSLLKTCGLFPITNGDQFLIGGYEAPFSSIFYEKTGQKSLFINVGWNGQSVEVFQPGQEGYNYATAAVTEAISQASGQGYHIKYGGILWSQGEANRFDSVDDYETWFNNVWVGVQKWGFTDIMISQTREAQGGNASIAQEDLAATIPGVYMATEISNTFSIDDGTMQPDNMHYTQKGRIIIADDVANYYLDNIYKAPIENPDGVKEIIAVIPIIVIVAIMIGCVALIARRYY